MRYKLITKDFDTAFEFALKYHLEPKKSKSSRTSGASRGLGGVLDSFILGKTVELGVASVLSSFNNKKIYQLDFDIKENNKVLFEPDIVGIIENGKSRKPSHSVEIKNISKSDRWLGLTAEQFETIKKASKLENIFIIGAYIENNNQGNEKQKDLLGIYLKNKFKDKSFKDFTSIDNINIVIDYAISGVELSKNGILFKKDFFMFETEVFQIAGVRTESDIFNQKIKQIGIFSKSGILPKYKMDDNYPEPIFMGDFIFNGDFKLYEKINSKSKKRYLKCISDVYVKNNILGDFSLNKGEIYLFNLCTLGRKPTLDRNNIWIAKRNVLFLQKRDLLKKSEDNLIKIAKEI